MKSPEGQIAQARFWKKYLRLTRGLVPTLRALQVIASEETDESFREVIEAVHGAVDKGEDLSKAIKKHPAVFSPSIQELVRMAERSGAWDDILEEIVDGLADGTFD
jgi:MSHA biogenesis protein MshG